jgi:hypothetical protein
LSSSDNTPGAILQPQPPPWDNDVKRGTAAVATSWVISISMGQWKKDSTAAEVGSMMIRQDA